jgi:hypothetical protein
VEVADTVLVAAGTDDEAVRMSDSLGGAGGRPLLLLPVSESVWLSKNLLGCPPSEITT